MHTGHITNMKQNLLNLKLISVLFSCSSQNGQISQHMNFIQILMELEGF